MNDAGSKEFPIAIDDSEEEVFHELFKSSYSPISKQLPPTNRANRNRISNERMAQGGVTVNHQDIKKAAQTGKRPQKRKRAQADLHNAHNSLAGSNQMKTPASTSDARQVALPSKKARKRQRRLERQVTEAGEMLKHQVWLNNARSSLPNPAFLPAPQSWSNKSMTFPMFEPQSAPLPSYMNQTFGGPQPHHTDHSAFIASSSAWVSSMALAAEATMHDNTWEPVFSPPAWPPDEPTHSDAPIPPSLPPAPQSRPIASSRKQRRNTITEPMPLPAEPIPIKPALPTAPPIGMKPEQDPSSKHGLFQIPATSSSSTSPYIPNPARTLVMEQLPKTHRNADFINSWCKKACGAHPVYLSIDAPGSKALIEFATAELARKAWSSPRLGQSLHIIPIPQLKGKPREDLIKVWWYRVDGVGAGAGVGEIEEGEIEGDAAEKEVDVPAKKETKKERKARLAKERMVKQAKLQKANVSAPSPQVSKIRPNPPSLPMNPNLYAQSTGIYTLPSGPGHVLPQPSSFLPRSTLERQWAAPKPKRPDPTSFGASAARSLRGGSSIASSRSPSPKPELNLALPKALRDSSTFEDIEFDPEFPEADMSSRGPASPRVMNHVEIARTTQQLEQQPFAPVAPVPVRPHAEPGIPLCLGTIPSMVSPAILSPALVSPPPSNAATPPLAPSEPRAMKNAPKGPSYAKRSLLARQKELQERIARSKTELALTTGNAQPLSGSPVSAAPSGENGVDPDKQAMEERLRVLVLQSQKKKAKPIPPATPPTNGAHESPSSPPASVSPPVEAFPDSGTIAAVALDSFSLDDLAVSFITETIQTFKSSAALAPVPPTPTLSMAVPTPSSSKIPAKSQLAARQQRLEQYIAESKVLMAQLTQARTKQEKDRIMATMRERSRLMEEDNQASTLTPTSATVSLVVGKGNQNYQPDNGSRSNGSGSGAISQQSASSLLIPQVSTMKWPDSYHSAGVLIVSDDEEDEEGSDDEEMA